MPIVIGYTPIAIAFGILSKTTGISMVDCLLFSVLVFAGASQFMALNLLSVGVGIGQIILTTLLVNFRHFLMSASIALRVETDMKKWVPIIAFGITDETFSVASFKEGQLTKEFLFALEFVSYFAWVSGSVLGYLLGGILPNIIKSSMGIGLYAMFAALLIPETKKSRKVLVLAILSGVINSLFTYFKLLPQGWSIVISIILVSYLGLYISEERKIRDNE